MAVDARTDARRGRGRGGRRRGGRHGGRQRGADPTGGIAVAGELPRSAGGEVVDAALVAVRDKERTVVVQVFAAVTLRRR